MFVKTGLRDSHFGGDGIHRHRLIAPLCQQAINRLNDGVFARLQHFFLEGTACGRGINHIEKVVLSEVK
jgi:hypothetical protein